MRSRFCILRLLPLVLAGCLLWACQGRKAPVPQKSAPTQAVSIPVCEPDSLLAFVKAQTDFGPRVPNSKAQKACAGYLRSKLESFGATVSVQEFERPRWDKVRLKGYNIIASFEPEKTRRVLLCAHWDSRPYADHDPDPKAAGTPIDGANDGASGTAVLLEVARLLQQQRPAVGVDIVLFDLEDSGKPGNLPHTQGDEYTWCLGSQHWSENLEGTCPMFGILLDMVGTENPCFVMEATSMYYAPDIMRKVWEKAALMGYGNIFVNRSSGALIDDHLFVNNIANIPTIDIIHYDNKTGSGFFPHWHTRQDNIGNICPPTLKTVGDVVLAVVFGE
ncbi:MAG: M28 family peptidase [Bacteroides sp.]|nr:M28 family peptidase [Ruminococcus flavefaciens]MCM1553971.1 M28 family peptidase [Bacteroides sp.]